MADKDAGLGAGHGNSDRGPGRDGMSREVSGREVIGRVDAGVTAVYGAADQDESTAMRGIIWGLPISLLLWVALLAAAAGLWRA